MDSRSAITSPRDPVTNVVAGPLLLSEHSPRHLYLVHLLKGQIAETRSQHLGARNGLDKDGLCVVPVKSP